METHDITAEFMQNVNVDALLNQREAVLKRIEQAMTLLKEAQTIAKQAHLEIPSFVMGSTYITRSYFPEDCFKLAELTEEARQYMDAWGWQYLMNASGLRIMMDEVARREWKGMCDHNCPVLTSAQIETIFSRLHAAREEMVERSILDVFRHLSWDHKAKQPVRLGKRLTVDCLLSTWGSNHQYISFDSKTTDHLDDLARVLSVLEGNPDPECHKGIYQCLDQAECAGCHEWNGPYFFIRWYKKGTGHLTLTRLDLVEKMNQIMLKHCPDALAAR